MDLYDRLDYAIDFGTVYVVFSSCTDPLPQASIVSQGNSVAELVAWFAADL
jgi:hypothetical protein